MYPKLILLSPFLFLSFLGLGIAKVSGMQMTDDEAVYKIDKITETNDDDIYDMTIEIDIADEINAINRSSNYAIQTGPNSLVILSEKRALTEAELEQIKCVDEKVRSNTIVFSSGGFANVLLNECSTRSSQEFSF